MTRSGGATAQPRLTYDRRIRRSQGARAQIAAMAPFLLSLQRFWIPAIHIYSPLITPRSTCLAGFLRDSSHAAEARPRDRLFADIGSIWSHILRDLQVPSFTGLHRYRTGFPDERRVGRPNPAEGMTHATPRYGCSSRPADRSAPPENVSNDGQGVQKEEGAGEGPPGSCRPTSATTDVT